MAISDPDRLKRIKGRLKEYRISHPQVFVRKGGEEHAGRVAAIVVEEFAFLVEEHKALVETCTQPQDDKDRKSAEAAYLNLQKIAAENQAVLEQNGFLRQVDSAMFRDMNWLCLDIDRLVRLQPAEDLLPVE